jgi:hypothetical protein
MDLAMQVRVVAPVQAPLTDSYLAFALMFCGSSHGCWCFNLLQAVPVLDRRHWIHTIA